MLKIIDKSKIWLTVSTLIILIGLSFIVFRGLNFGIDFKGGTVAVVDFGKEPSTSDIENIREIGKKYDTGIIVNISDKQHIEIKSSKLDNDGATSLYKDIKTEYKLDDKALLSEEQIGASVGRELTNKALIALAIATIAMLIYVGIRFEFRFGAAAIIALLHDVLITISFYAIFNITLNSSFIAAILTIVGYSINDTIVIFDRIRKNLKQMRGKTFSEIANVSVNQTLARSINTSLTTVTTIAAVFVLVPSIRDFTLPLIVGILAGAYSSIFVASPVWVMLRNRAAKGKTVKA